MIDCNCKKKIQAEVKTKKYVPYDGFRNVQIKWVLEEGCVSSQSGERDQRFPIQIDGGSMRINNGLNRGTLKIGVNHHIDKS